MDVGPYGVSLADQVGRGNIVVLRSFGKFYGLPGLAAELRHRSARNRRAASRAALGPWPVSGAALAVGAAALADMTWREKTRGVSCQACRRLEALLAKAGLEIVGGTSLFRLVRTKDAASAVSAAR